MSDVVFLLERAVAVEPPVHHLDQSIAGLIINDCFYTI